MTAHNITFKGEVQDVGLRDSIRRLGQDRDRRGYAYNEDDGTVRMVTNGSKEEAKEFIEDVKEHAVAAEISEVTIEQIEGDPFLPPFRILDHDGIDEINRKLGKGIRILTNVKDDTSELPGVKQDTGALVDGQQQMIDILDDRL